MAKVETAVDVMVHGYRVEVVVTPPDLPLVFRVHEPSNKPGEAGPVHEVALPEGQGRELYAALRERYAGGVT